MENISREGFEKMTAKHEEEKQQFLNKAHEYALEENKFTPRELLSRVLRKKVEGSSDDYDDVHDYYDQKDRINEILIRHPELRDDEEMMLGVINLCNEDSWGLDQVSETLRDNKQFVLKAIKRNPMFSSRLSDELKDDKDVALMVVKRPGSGMFLENMSKRLRQDEEVLLQAIKSGYPLYRIAERNNDNTWYSIPEKFQHRKDFLIAAARSGDYDGALDYASTEDKNDEDFLAALGSNDSAMGYLDSQIKKHEKSLRDDRLYEVYGRIRKTLEYYKNLKRAIEKVVQKKKMEKSSETEEIKEGN
jgi:hypothetical protein